MPFKDICFSIGRNKTRWGCLRPLIRLFSITHVLLSAPFNLLHLIRDAKPHRLQLRVFQPGAKGCIYLPEKVHLALSRKLLGCVCVCVLGWGGGGVTGCYCVQPFHPPRILRADPANHPQKHCPTWTGAKPPAGARRQERQGAKERRALRGRNRRGPDASQRRLAFCQDSLRRPFHHKSQPAVKPPAEISSASPELCTPIKIRQLGGGGGHDS